MLSVKLDEESKTQINIIRAVYGNEFTTTKNVNVFRILLENHVADLKEANPELIENVLIAINEINDAKPKLTASSIFA